MFGRTSRSARLQRDLPRAGARAADTLGDLAEQALAAAREAGRAASPTVQASAETLGKALERAAEVLAETGEKLAKTGAGEAARERIADVSEKLAETIRPKPKRHRLRRLLIGTAIVGGAVALFQSPLRAKISERLFGPPPDEEPESIELPGSEPRSFADEGTSPSPSEASAEDLSSSDLGASAPEGNGVPSAPSPETSQS